MKKFLIQSILLSFVIAFALLLGSRNFLPGSIPFIPTAGTKSTVLIKGFPIRVDIADTKQERSKGLSGRQSIASDEGMLFIYETPGKYAFWMKGLIFPLDFIWIKGQTVVDLLENVPPAPAGAKDDTLPIYEPKFEVDKVLETPAGTIQRLGIQIGDVIEIK